VRRPEYPAASLRDYCCGALTTQMPTWNFRLSQAAQASLSQLVDISRKLSLSVKCKSSVGHSARFERDDNPKPKNRSRIPDVVLPATRRLTFRARYNDRYMAHALGLRDKRSMGGYISVDCDRVGCGVISLSPHHRSIRRSASLRMNSVDEWALRRHIIG
jgi:hypothetical protein